MEATFAQAVFFSKCKKQVLPHKHVNCQKWDHCHCSLKLIIPIEQQMTQLKVRMDVRMFCYKAFGTKVSCTVVVDYVSRAMVIGGFVQQAQNSVGS